MLPTLLATVLAALCTVALAPVAPQHDTRTHEALTLDRALALARERAPALLDARSRRDEASGRLDEASLPFADDPVLETEVGRRKKPDGRSTDWTLALSQRFEAWGARSARIGFAQAELLAAEAGSGDTERLLLADVAEAFDELLLADQRLAVLSEVRRVADDLRRIVERRQQVGGSAQLEVNLSQSAAARAGADEARARATRGDIAARLRTQLGLPPDDPVTVRGELLSPWTAPLDELLALARTRPDLTALQAEIETAESELGMAESLRRPGFDLSIGFAQDDGDDITALGLDIGLPIYGRGRGLRSAAAARSSALQARLAAARAAVEGEVRAAFEAHALMRAAADDFERSALAGLDENEALARQSWEAGAMNLIELLQVRRELLETRQAWLELQFDAAAARVRLQAAAGVLP